MLARVLSAMMVAVILCSLLQGASSKKQGERFAFVTLHYEGTKGDAEYILGIRVLMASLRGSQYPFIILASDSVSQSSIDLFTAEGATVIPVDNIENPFTHGLARFKYTFNKLHLWNMTDYDRLIYMDADNIVVNRTIVEELFYCGHFCVVYMNPCHFHTGLMVVKPDGALFETMLKELATTGSYDGADQGFLSEFFRACDEAPMFNPAKGPSEHPLNQLHIGYNMHAIYRLGYGNFERFRCGSFQHCADLPAASIGYPVPVVIKPWYWWSPLLGISDDWNVARRALKEPELWSLALSRLSVLAVFVWLIKRILHSRTSVEPKLYAWHHVIQRVGLKRAAAFSAVISIVLAIRTAHKAVPTTVPTWLGILLFSSIFFSLLLLLSRAIGHYVFLIRATPTDPITRPMDFAQAVVAFVAIFFGFAEDKLFAMLLGGGLYIPILRACVVLSTALLTILNVFLKLPARSPISNLMPPQTSRS